MKSPFTGKDMSIQKEWRFLSFRKEKFRVCFHAYKCEDTGYKTNIELNILFHFLPKLNQYVKNTDFLQ